MTPLTAWSVLDAGMRSETADEATATVASVAADASLARLREALPGPENLRARDLVARLFAEADPELALRHALPALADERALCEGTGLGALLGRHWQVRVDPDGDGALVKVTTPAGFEALRLVAPRLGGRVRSLLLELRGEASSAVSRATEFLTSVRGAPWLQDLRRLEVWGRGPFAEGFFETLGELRGLERLSLKTFRSGLDDRGLLAIAKLGRLRALAIMEPLRPAFAACLRALTGLGRLDLSQCGPLEPAVLDALAALPALHDLVLDGNSLRAEAAALGALPRLRSLAVRSNGVDDKGARAIAKLGSLARLDLSSNKIGAAGLEALGSMSCLEALDLSDNPVGAKADAWKLPPSLIELSLARVGITVRPNLEGLGRLRTLDLSGNRTRQLVDGVAHLERLSALGLDTCDLSGKDLSPLRKLVRLREIDVRLNERFADAGAQTVSALPELLALNCQRTGLGNSGFAELRPLAKLELLSVVDNGIDELGASTIAAFRRLRVLHVGQNPIGAGIRHIGALVGLRALYANDCQIDGVVFDTLEALPPHGYVELANNEITDEAVSAMGRCKQLRYLGLGGNALSAEGLAAAAAALPDTEVST